MEEFIYKISFFYFIENINMLKSFKNFVLNAKTKWVTTGTFHFF